MSNKLMLAFAPKYNTEGRSDATGAFIPEAKRFLAHHDVDLSQLELVDNHATRSRMRVQVLDRIAMCQKIVGVFFFCHGYRKGFQLGFDNSHLLVLAKEIRTVTGNAPVVTFYACDVARDADAARLDDLETMGGDGGFCDEVRDALCRAGAIRCTVDGHTTPGHTTKNPYVRRFNGNGSQDGGVGGFYIVPKEKKILWNKWVAALKTDYRFSYPLRTELEIIDHLMTT